MRDELRVVILNVVAAQRVEYELRIAGQARQVDPLPVFLHPELRPHLFGCTRWRRPLARRQYNQRTVSERLRVGFPGEVYLLEFLRQIVILWVVLRAGFAVATWLRDGASGSLLAEANPSSISDAAQHVALVCRIDEHNASDVTAILFRIKAHEEPAYRLPDEHERAGQLRGPKECVQLEYFLSHGAGRGAWLTPAQPGAVVCTGPHARRQKVLHLGPTTGVAPTAGFEEDGRLSVRRADAADM